MLLKYRYTGVETSILQNDKHKISVTSFYTQIPIKRKINGDYIKKSKTKQTYKKTHQLVQLGK